MCALRYFNIFGPRQDPSSPYSGVLAKFCTGVPGRYATRSLRDGEQTRDFTFVEEAVQANLLACESAERSGKVFNVGTGGRTSLNDVLKALGKITGKTLETKYEPARDGDIRDSQADIFSSARIPRLRSPGRLRKRAEPHVWSGIGRARRKRLQNQRNDWCLAK